MVRLKLCQKHKQCSSLEWKNLLWFSCSDTRNTFSIHYWLITLLLKAPIIYSTVSKTQSHSIFLYLPHLLPYYTYCLLRWLTLALQRSLPSTNSNLTNFYKESVCSLQVIPFTILWSLSTSWDSLAAFMQLWTHLQCTFFVRFKDLI